MIAVGGRAAAQVALVSCHLWFIRLKNAPGFARGFSRHKSGVQWYLPTVGQLAYNGPVWRNGVRLCGDATGRGISRLRCVNGASRPLMVLITRGRFLESHWTPDPCLKKSNGAAAYEVLVCVCARFRRMNPISSDLAPLNEGDRARNSSETPLWLRQRPLVSD
jgi:hypothetical protein